jgi:hypothetical protein
VAEVDDSSMYVGSPLRLGPVNRQLAAATATPRPASIRASVFGLPKPAVAVAWLVAAGISLPLVWKLAGGEFRAPSLGGLNVFGLAKCQGKGTRLTAEVRKPAPDQFGFSGLGFVREHVSNG